MAAGRYFSIPPSWNTAFRNCLAGDAPAEQADFAASKLVAAGILCGARDVGPTRDPEPFVAPTEIRANEADRVIRISMVLRALWHQMWVASDLKRHGFQYVIRDLELRRKGPFRTERVNVVTEVNSFNAAFTFTEFAISRADNCLIRSIALLRMLRAAGGDGLLVIGVTASPFSAHAWVQRGAVLLNDSLDRVRIFSPILVV
ncbi:lasso peptide biosynthesis B2 protein [Sphingobium fuliginis]|uniref:Lasso peptide biosynthesis B2 protein n=1 Tax=Sphingobium fuliginis (strain ATCC 27551) TaxID=336203 RepID=A0A7M2GIE1_SPHSA|nr:lasso peptide biosynthesis B2 protein [Sphingobium fuliginis]QOT72268.1 lasso peptide biosynthesis B2 protein [Sphingobium fuliginis]